MKITSDIKDLYLSYKDQEITGNFILDDNGTLNIDYNSIIVGYHDSTILTSGLYTFHTHPIATYKKYNTKVAWPSSIDYQGILLGKKVFDTRLHVVVTKEGLYTVKICDQCIDDDILNFVDLNLDISFESDLSPKEYSSKIQTVHYKGKCVFKVYFREWK